jgi:glycine/D-amino acid oxidase-like deaminating enzyme
MKFTPYWLDSSPQGPDRSSTDVGGTMDVAVVGAGLTGLSAALHVARMGAKVAVFERETVAFGASGRNGGMVTPGLAIGFRRAIARYGFPTASALFLTYNDAIDSVEKLVAEEGIDCDFASTGKMNLAAKPDHYDGFQKTHEVLAERLGYQTHLVSKSEMRSEIGSDYYHGAMIDPKGAGLHVGKFTRGLAESAARLGVQIHEKAPVEKVVRLDGTRHRVVTPRGSVRANQVLVATSGYTGRPFRWLQVRIVPVGSFIIVTEPLGKEVCDQLLPKRRMSSDSKNLLYYFRITPDHRLLFGGRARFALSSPDSDVKSGKMLRNAMIELFPYLSDAKVDYTWGGLVDLSMDQMVHAGVHDGLFYSLCYSGHGVQMAAHMGKKMVRYMGGDKTANVWEGLKNPPVPGHFGPPWFLPIIGGAAKIIDRIK